MAVLRYCAGCYGLCQLPTAWAGMTGSRARLHSESQTAAYPAHILPKFTLCKFGRATYSSAVTVL